MRTPQAVRSAELAADNYPLTIHTVSLPRPMNSFSRFVLFASLVGSALAQDSARIDQFVQSFVTNKQFMGTVLVARGDDVLFSKGYGFANLEWNVANTPNTKFRLGSITKQFTATAILLLEERGKLSVDDLVKQHLPDAPAAWDKISIRHVLTHTSGIPSFTGFPEYPKFKLSATTTADIVATFRDRPLEFEPGESYNYSNSGYVLLTHLVEKISGQPYEQFIRENIFTPLGMKDSGYDSNSAIIPRRAAGYSVVRDVTQNADFIHMTVPQGAGALYSTTEDLLKWERGLFGGKVLKPASLEKMTQPFKNKYGFGLIVDAPSGRKVIMHGGGIEGFNTELEYYPEKQVTVVVLANLNGPAVNQIARQLAGLAHGDAVKLPSERKEITLDASILSRYVGAYGLGPGMLISIEGDQLISKLGNQPNVPLFAESETLFFAKVVDAQVEFPPTAPDTKATEMVLHQNGRDQVAKRLDEAATQQIVDAAARAAKRFRDQTPVPGGEEVLRKNIEGLRAGNPDYEAMSPGLANITRQQLPQLQSLIVRLGAIQSITFKSVGPGGADIYVVKLEKGSLEYRIWISADGKLDNAGVRALP